MTRKRILYSHDGGLDDYLCVVLLLTLPDIELLGIVVTPADCYIDPAVSATRKILDLMGRSDIPVAASTVRGVNPFPRALRRTSFQVDNLPLLNTSDQIRTPLVTDPGQSVVVQMLRDAPEPVIFLETGPLTTLAAAIQEAPDIQAHIHELVWMGGALNVPGNVDPYLDANVDGSAEFNAYWDPDAVRDVWATDLPIVMCPLDLTNQVPLTTDFMRHLGRNHCYQLSDFVGQCYALVRHQPYYFWDVLTTTYVLRPELFKTRVWGTEVIASGASQGRTKMQPGGRPVTVLDAVDVDGFYDFILQQWAR